MTIKINVKERLIKNSSTITNPPPSNQLPINDAKFFTIFFFI